MNWKKIAALLAFMAVGLCGCSSKEPEPPLPYETENMTITLSFGEFSAEGSYSGWMLDTLPEGEGSFTTAEGLTFTGTVAAGEARDGQVENLPLTLVWDEIAYTGLYTGEVTAALAQGQGSFAGQSETGLSLELRGQWKQGLPQGEGYAVAELYTALWGGRERPGTYEGETLDGLPHGEGSFRSQDETGPFAYTGQWEDGAFHGQGCLEYEGNQNYLRRGTFTSGGFTPTYFEALNTVFSYEPLYTLTEENYAFLEQYPGLWEAENDRRNFEQSEYRKLIDHFFYHDLLFRHPEKCVNTWVRLRNCRLLDRREVTFDNGMTIHSFTAVDGAYIFNYQCYLVGDIPEEFQQRSWMDMYIVPLGMSHYTNSLGQEESCVIAVVGDIRIR